MSVPKQANRRLGVWQRRFDEHEVRADVFETLMAYAHFNPVKHGDVRCPHEWPWSTFHRWVMDGRSPHDWRCVCNGPSAGPIERPEWADSLE